MPRIRFRTRRTGGGELVRRPFAIRPGAPAPAPARPDDRLLPALALALAAIAVAVVAIAKGAAAAGHVAMLLATGAAAGVASGLLGVGGGFLLVPALAAMGMSLPMAAGTSLFYVAAVGVGAVRAHHHAGTLDTPLVLRLAGPAMAGGVAGALLTALLPAAVLSIGFVAFLAYIARQLGKPPHSDDPATAPLSRAAGEGGGDARIHGHGAVHAAPSGGDAGWGQGALVGGLCGLFGVGGGLLFTAMQVEGGTPLKLAVANSAGVVLATGVAGLLTHAALGHLDLVAGIWLAAGGWAGVGAGVALLGGISVKWLRAMMLAALALSAVPTLFRAF